MTEAEGTNSWRSPKVSRIITICPLLLFLSVIVYLVLSPASEVDMDVYLTNMQLDGLCKIAQIMMFIQEIDPTQFDSLDTFLDAASKEKILNIKEYKDGSYSRDSWKNAIHMRVTQKEQTTLIEFISSGENCVFENGNGDDLVRRCEFKRNRIKQEKK